MYWQFREQQLKSAPRNSEQDVMRSLPELALTVGNPGVLLKTGLLRSVEPTEDGSLLAADNPMVTGTFQVDHVAREARESFMIQQLLKSNDQVMILVCGRGHEFQDNVPDGVKVVRIPVPILSETISDSP